MQRLRSAYGWHQRRLCRTAKAGLVCVGMLCLLMTANAQARWLSVDPVQPNPRSGDNFNRYWYANNSPMLYTDPDGRQAFMGWSQKQIHLPPEQAAKTTSTMTDFAPVIGDIKAVYQFIRDPTPGNFAAAGVGLVPIVGDVGSRMARHGDAVAELAVHADRAAGAMPQASLTNATWREGGAGIAPTLDKRYQRTLGADGNRSDVRIDTGTPINTPPSSAFPPATLREWGRSDSKFLRAGKTFYKNE